MTDPVRRHATPTAIYTLGPEGTFSDKAARLVSQRIVEGVGREFDEPTTTFLPSISTVFERALNEDGAIGVVPIENSVAGTVHVVQDLLARYDAWIEYEIQVPVAFKLLVRGDPQLAGRVFVHPIAERQCAEALQQHVPRAQVVFTDSNTDSAVRLLATADLAAAVVPVDYREPSDAALITMTLPTVSHNTTRFIAVRRAPADPQPAFASEKMTLLVTPRTNRPGLLHEILGAFRLGGMNLTRIESRPADGCWEYVFFLDATLSPQAPEAWRALQQGDWAVRLLGCYPVLRAPQ